MSEPYTLKTRVGINTLSHLNDHQKNRMGRIKGALECFSTNDSEEIVDLVYAVFSGKKIVNPRTDSELLDEIKKKHNYYSASEFGTPITLDHSEYSQLIKWSEQGITGNGGDSNA
jgi:hypothetical protein